MDLQQLDVWEAQLIEDVAKLRTALGHKEEELLHVQRLRELRNGPEETPSSPAVPVLPRQSSGRVSIAPLHVSYFELNGQRFSSPGELLDAVGEPHYFSAVRGKQGDAAQRKILTWARSNAHIARSVKAVLPDGNSFSLWDIADRNR